MNYRSSRLLAAIALTIVALCLPVLADATKTIKANNAGMATDLYGVAPGGPPGVAAMVNGHEFKISDVKAWSLRENGPAVVSKLIDNYLIDEECARLHITVTPAEITSARDAMVASMSPQTLEDALKSHRETLEEMNDDILHEIERQRLVTRAMKPAKMAHIRDIFIPVTGPGLLPPGENHHTDEDAHSIADYIIDQLKAGKDFSTLAAEYSEDTNSKNNGGDAGVVYDGSTFDAAVVKAALQLKKGEVSSKPIKSPSGYVLVQVVSTGDSHDTTENQAYAIARQKYDDVQRHDVEMQVMTSLKARAHIVNYLP